MARRSAGLIPFRWVDGDLEVFLGHMGGPLWARKEAGAWTVVKGEYDDAEESLAAAEREFVEETGHPAPDGPRVPLGTVRQKGGKEVVAWAVEGDVDADACVSGTFEMEWPPRSGRRETFPEIDRFRWWALDDAKAVVVSAQTELLDRLAATTGVATGEVTGPPSSGPPSSGSP